jgi:hypothetical protein
MNHWANKYIGKPWMPENDCYWWFREIMKNEFGRDIPVVCAGYDRSLQIASRLLTKENAELWGWRATIDPKEGDAVFLSRSKKFNTHIGTVFFVKGHLMVLHALKGSGVVASDYRGLKANGLFWKGFWTPCK